MRRAVLLALAALAVAADEPPVSLPAASEATKPVPGAAVVHLTEDGLVVIDREGKNERVSLDQLAQWLRARKSEAAGKELRVAIRADGKAPCLHIQRIVEICAEEGLARFEWGVKGAAGEEGRLAAPAPTDPTPKEVARVVVRMTVTKDRPAVWGPTQTAIGLPTEVTFKIGEVESTELLAVRRFIRDAGQTAAQNGERIAGTLAPGARVPWATVVEILNEFRRAGIEDVRFTRPAEAATPEERRAPRLAYPAK